MESQEAFATRSEQIAASPCRENKLEERGSLFENFKFEGQIISLAENMFLKTVSQAIVPSLYPFVS